MSEERRRQQEAAPVARRPELTTRVIAPAVERRTQLAFVLLILAQTTHSLEEYVTRTALLLIATGAWLSKRRAASA
jgi:hypothetical protein